VRASRQLVLEDHPLAEEDYAQLLLRPLRLTERPSQLRLVDEALADQQLANAWPTLHRGRIVECAGGAELCRPQWAGAMPATDSIVTSGSGRTPERERRRRSYRVHTEGACGPLETVRFA
jgi:hypothetical protein